MVKPARFPRRRQNRKNKVLPESHYPRLQFPEPLSIRQWPSFRKRAKMGSFSFEEKEQHTYEEPFPEKDLPKRFMPSLIPITVDHPHLVLLDKRGNSRYSLRYDKVVLKNGEKRTDVIMIESLQRERTPSAYAKSPHGMIWRPSQETRLSKLFGNELGMHPAEFLLSEFIYRLRHEFRTNPQLRVFFVVRQPDRKLRKDEKLVDDGTSTFRYYGIYRPLIERFFRSSASGVLSRDPNIAFANPPVFIVTPEKQSLRGQDLLFELSFEKKRVKELLSAP